MKFHNALFYAACTATFLLATGCSNEESPPPAEPSAGDVDGARIAAAASEPGNWLAHGRTYDEQRHSPLDQINDQSIGDLGLAWYWDTNTTRGLEATPIVVDGVMYTTGSWSVVWAHDARNGELLWSYDPEVPRDYGKYACCDVVNRGAAVWKGSVYSGTIDGRLIAINATTGELEWKVQTTDPERPYTITGAPRIVKGKVIIGNGGAEYGVRGYITAYDAATGDQLWRFYTVPGDPSQPFESPAMEHAATTWRGGKWWEIGGGGTVWDSMAYDPELNLLYIGVGNGSPWNRYLRSPGGGDNLYLSSMVAINPDDGSMLWYYQTTPGDTWDYTAVQHMILADIEIGDEMRKVIMQAPKNGFFYVIDRTNGEFISAEAYVPVTWATRIDPETGRPVENPDAHYANDVKKIRPGPLGGHNWHPMAYSPETGYVYIPALNLSFKYGQDNAFRYQPENWNLGVDMTTMAPASDPDQLIADLQDVKGFLTAWDPVAQKEVWRVQHPLTWNGGLLSTSGNLVFQGRADGHFAAYKADTGSLAWEYPVDVGIMAAPVTYTIDGEQYVAVVAGWGGGFGLTSGVPRHRNNVLDQGRILAFKLGGKAQLPDPEVVFIDLPQPPDIDTTPEQVDRGLELYHLYCSVCHGPGVTASTGGIPDLRYASADTHASWKAIVHDGAYSQRGMAGFSHVLSEEDTTAIQAYVVETVKATIGLCEGEYRTNYPELLDTACTRAAPGAASGGGR
ncbi:MAG: PQQ-dependent dehydrogenase, methanol/ethanol family [Pseudomonadales bacterium]|jgi:PQQ-dependent dehydrogenase (methanol/ethanol family)|nr:PQQ-dependent dehydrogenase, methanol/ethanol family [Pseudomonadales bacterium]MDP6471453.1 PQQ-dependent dehydrogenase, methanol/ethanol family [Pseudomonadales bacterium]MDP6828622.1 PQQ-dependent dehydrogenase, methanol/ethanol family [Pseudomonadales bacterium]MDP6972341.1 PQQ-dependent dehydrogenase, methanol/ethanol family [Pseudomonadales bacterium]